MTTLKSQFLGILLAITTAIGCIAYEKLISRYSMMTIAILKIVECIIVFGIASMFFDGSIKEDIKLSRDKFDYASIITFILAGMTSLVWYVLAKDQSVMAAASYEFKYMVILAIIYIFLGKQQFNLNMLIGCLLAMLSVYFVSKS